MWPAAGYQYFRHIQVLSLGLYPTCVVRLDSHSHNSLVFNKSLFNSLPVLQLILFCEFLRKTPIAVHNQWCLWLQSLWNSLSTMKKCHAVMTLSFKVVLWSKNHFLFFLPILKAYSLNVQLAKFRALCFIRRLFILSVSFGFRGLPVLTFKTGRQDIRGLDVEKMTSFTH